MHGIGTTGTSYFTIVLFLVAPARCPRARSAPQRRGRSRRVMRDSSGRERRMATVNLRSLRSVTVPTSTEPTPDRLHAMAHFTHLPMIRFMDIHMALHRPQHAAQVYALLCRFTFSHRHRNRRAHTSKCWQAVQNEENNTDKHKV